MAGNENSWWAIYGSEEPDIEQSDMSRMNCFRR